MLKNYKDMLHIVSTNSKQEQIVDARPPNLFNGNILSEKFHISREMAPHLSRKTPHLLSETSNLSREMPHLSREAPHVSRETPHPLREAPHISREMPWHLQNSGYCCSFFIHLLNYKIKDSFRF
jgi:hypothetical protein